MGAVILYSLMSWVYPTPELDGLPGLCPASFDGARIPPASTISRLVPRTQRASQHAYLLLHVAMEHQVDHRGSLDCWWS